MKTTTDYDKQAQDFLAQNGLSIRIVLGSGKSAPWASKMHKHYRVTIAGVQRRIAFDFWSASTPSEYDVLACLSSDVYCPDTFDGFCSEYGYDSDSISAKQTFRRCASFAARLRNFFTAPELEQLSEIQ